MKLYFANGVIVDVRNAELLRVAIRASDPETLTDSGYAVTLDVLADGRSLCVFDVPRSSGEPFDASDEYPTYVRYYAGKTTLERVKGNPGKPVRRFHQQDSVDFDIDHDSPITLRIE